MRRLIYPVPLTPEDRADLFADWMEANPEAMAEIEAAAVAISWRGKRVSTRYLVERQRYEGKARLTPIPFRDVHGNVHSYGINNNDTPILARYLKEKYPDMDIELRRYGNE